MEDFVNTQRDLASSSDESSDGEDDEDQENKIEE
jgi:hypothetical protein